MPLDHYLTLGRSGLSVSPFWLGAMTFGEEWGWGATVGESEAMLAAFMERGGNFIDTANGYTRGHSERIIGDCLGRDCFLNIANAIMHSGATVNGEPSARWSKAPASDADRY